MMGYGEGDTTGNEVKEGLRFARDMVQMVDEAHKQCKHGDLIKIQNLEGTITLLEMEKKDLENQVRQYKEKEQS